MDILIVGAGVAGLTLAAKLLQQGRRPVIVERAPAFTDQGYAIVLYPLGSCVLHGLGKFDEAMASAQVGRTYGIVDGKGRVLQEVDLSVLGGEIGPMVLLTRTRLIEILQDAASGADLRFGTSVTGLDQSRGDKVDVTFSDGTSGAFDLVVCSDGIHSQTRTLAFGPNADVFDTGWVLWVWWAELPDWPPSKYVESWGHGRFFGLYPAPGHAMCAAGMNSAHLTVDPSDLASAKPFLKDLYAEMIASNETVGQAIDAATKLFAWPMSDVRAQQWSTGRVGLLGDAAAGFLPTAGAGANTAMRCAASLADELSRVDGRLAPLALDVYEKRCRHIVEKNQKDSRVLAKMIFVENAVMSWGRDEIIKHYPMTKLVQDVIDSMHEPF